MALFLSSIICMCVILAKCVLCAPNAGPGRRQVITWTNIVSMSNGQSEQNWTQISIKVQQASHKDINMKIQIAAFLSLSQGINFRFNLRICKLCRSSQEVCSKYMLYRALLVWLGAIQNMFTIALMLTEQLWRTWVDKSRESAKWWYNQTC